MFITTTKNQLAYPRLLTIAYNATSNTQTLVSPDLVGVFNVYVNNVYVYDSQQRTASSTICAFLSSQIRQNLQQLDSKNITGTLATNWVIPPYDYNFTSQGNFGKLSNPCHLGVFQFNGAFDIRTVAVNTNLFPATVGWVAYEFHLEYLGRDIYNYTKPSPPKFILPSEFSYCINICGDATINNVPMGISGEFMMEVAQIAYSIPEPNEPNTAVPFVITSNQFMSEGVSALDILPTTGSSFYKPTSLIFFGQHQHQIFCEPYKVRVRLDNILQITASRETGVALPVFIGGFAVISLLVNLKRV